jgi:hypothetical protein
MEPDRTCDACGRTFTPARADARYCSGACRAKASRERKRDEASPPPLAAIKRPTASNTAPQAPLASPDPPPDGLRADLVERFFDMEDRVAELGDDLQVLKDVEQRIADLRGKVEQAINEARRRAGPDEATIRTLANEAAHAETRTLARRIHALENRPPEARSDGHVRGEIAALDQRLAAIEARPVGRVAAAGHDPGLQGKVHEIERACIRLGRRLTGLEADVNKLALAFAQHVYGEAGGEDDVEE